MIPEFSQQIFEKLSNIKISSVVSNINGKTGMNLLEFVLNNDEEITLENVEKLIISNVSASKEAIVNAMDGIITPFQKVMMKEVIKHINELTQRIKEMDKIIYKYMNDYKEALARISKMPGIGKRSGEIILAEIGLDMKKFPTAGHISSWAGISPGNNESAGKRKSGKTRKGNKTLKSILTQCAKSAVMNKNNFYYAQYQRLVVKRGANRATVAVAHSMLISIYYILKDNIEYIDLGSDFYHKFNAEKKIKSYLKKLADLGYDFNKLVKI